MTTSKKKVAAKKVASKKAVAKKAPAKKAVAKKAPAKKVASKKKIDGKALAAKRKGGDSIAQYIRDAVAAGQTDVDKILADASREFPGKKATRGYVRWIARHDLKKELPPTKRVVKSKAKAKSKAPAATDDQGVV